MLCHILLPVSCSHSLRMTNSYASHFLNPKSRLHSSVNFSLKSLSRQGPSLRRLPYGTQWVADIQNPVTPEEKSSDQLTTFPSQRNSSLAVCTNLFAHTQSWRRCAFVWHVQRLHIDATSYYFTNFESQLRTILVKHISYRIT